MKLSIVRIRFLSFVRILVFKFCHTFEFWHFFHNLSFWVLEQFEFFSFITVWFLEFVAISVIEFCCYLRFVTILDFEFLVLSQFEFLSGYNFSHWFWSQLEFQSFITLWVLEFCLSLTIWIFSQFWFGHKISFRFFS